MYTLGRWCYASWSYWMVSLSWLGKGSSHLVLPVVRIWSASEHACTKNRPGPTKNNWTWQKCFDWVLAHEQADVRSMALAGIFSILYVTLGGTQGEQCAFTNCTSQFAMTSLSTSWLCKLCCNSIGCVCWLSSFIVNLCCSTESFGYTVTLLYKGHAGKLSGYNEQNRHLNWEDSMWPLQRDGLCGEVVISRSWTVHHNFVNEQLP